MKVDTRTYQGRGTVKGANMEVATRYEVTRTNIGELLEGIDIQLFDITDAHANALRHVRPLTLILQRGSEIPFAFDNKGSAQAYLAGSVVWSEDEDCHSYDQR